MKRPGLLFFVLLVLSIFSALAETPIARAHPFNYGAIRTKLEVQDKQIKLRTTTPQKIRYPIPAGVNQQKFFEQYFSKTFTVKNNGQSCGFKLSSFNDPGAKRTDFRGNYLCPKPVKDLGDLIIHSELFNDYFADTDHFVDLTWHGKLESLVFTQSKKDYPKDVKPIPKTTFGRVYQVAREFIIAGAKHIWTGYDHILFLVSVVLLVHSLKKILILVSAFTIAHSITLILAGLKIIVLSPRIVEPLIALTIIYVATRNAQALLNNKTGVNLGEREATTAGFGLIHGLGFAGALLAADIPKAYFVPSLLFFNVGVEIGQLAIMIILIPLLIQIRKLPQKREILFAITLAIITVSTFWFLQRVFIG